MRILSRAYGIRADQGAASRDVLLQEGRTGVIVAAGAAGRYLACWVPVDATLEVAVVEAGDELGPGGLEAAYSPSELVGRSRNTVTIPSSRPFAILDLRVERK